MFRSFLPSQILVLSLVIVSPVGLPACTCDSASTVEMDVYHSVTEGLTIKYPSNWTHTLDGQLLFQPQDAALNPLGPKISLEVISGISGLEGKRRTLDEAAELAVKMLAKKYHIQTIVDKEHPTTKIAGQAIVHSSVTFKVEDQAFVQDLYFIPYRNDILALYYLSGEDQYYRNLPIFHEMITSLKISAPVDLKSKK